MNTNVEIFVQDQPWALNLGVWLVDRRADGSNGVAAPVVFAPVPEGESTPPSLSLSREAAQDLMSRMWQLGIRPREGEGTLAHVSAMQQHIEDLRKVAFKGEATRPMRSSADVIKFGSVGKV